MTALEDRGPMTNRPIKPLRLLCSALAVAALAGCGLLGGTSYETALEVHEVMAEESTCDPSASSTYTDIPAGNEEGYPASSFMFFSCTGEDPGTPIEGGVFVALEDASGEEIGAAAQEDSGDAFMIVGENWAVVLTPDAERSVSTETWGKDMAKALGGEFVDPKAS